MSIGNAGEHWHKFGTNDGSLNHRAPYWWSNTRSCFHFNPIPSSTLCEVLANGSTVSICAFMCFFSSQQRRAIDSLSHASMLSILIVKYNQIKVEKFPIKYGCGCYFEWWYFKKKCWKLFYAWVIYVKFSNISTALAYVESRKKITKTSAETYQKVR